MSPDGQRRYDPGLCLEHAAIGPAGPHRSRVRPPPRTDVPHLLVQPFQVLRPLPLRPGYAPFLCRPICATTPTSTPPLRRAGGWGRASLSAATTPSLLAECVTRGRGLIVVVFVVVAAVVAGHVSGVCRRRETNRTASETRRGARLNEYLSLINKSHLAYSSPPPPSPSPHNSIFPVLFFLL